jgi:alpha-L-fucosidase
MLRPPFLSRPVLTAVFAALLLPPAGLLSAAAPAAAPAVVPAAPVRMIAPGPFQPNWNSLVHYQCPDWFRDAKLGFWARWDAQSVPEKGDDYARNLYIPTDPLVSRPNADYIWHLDHYGHPTQFGFKDLLPLWTVGQWEPEQILALYRRAGARYFVALANDHDNFDCFDSKYQPWNSVAIGPHRDIVGVWAAAARAAGLRFGVSASAADAWSWFEPAQHADAAGPFFGLGYDGRLTAVDGHGTWWDGLDPQDLYAQNHRLGEKPDEAYVTKYFLRIRDLIDHYHPDLLAFDSVELPLGEAGLNLAAHYYNSSLAANHGQTDVVLTTHQVRPIRRPALVEAMERVSTDGLRPEPWQAESSLGQWQYRAGQEYRGVPQLVRLLVDVVSKNGNLLLNVPLHSSGIPDPDEVKILDDLADWMTIHGEGIFATRPWRVYGEGPVVARPAPSGSIPENHLDFTAQDFRFTVSKDRHTLYVFFFGRPPDGRLTVRSLAKTGTNSDPPEQSVISLGLLGSPAVVSWTQDANGLEVTLPATLPNDFACALKVGLE